MQYKEKKIEKKNQKSIDFYYILKGEKLIKIEKILFLSLNLFNLSFLKRLNNLSQNFFKEKMGNASSDVNDSLKAQADSGANVEMFKILNFGSEGALEVLMKEASKSKNYTQVDEYIKTEVSKFLYNDGQGEHVFH
jgi:hypothetical protein